MGPISCQSKMAAEGVSPFPLPPTQYYTLYTDSNVEQDRGPKPPAPVEGIYSMFGASFEVFELENYGFL